MMDAMISRCVDEINLSERQLCVQRKGQEAPIYSWEMRGEWEGHCVAACCQGALLQVLKSVRRSVQERSAWCVRQ